MPLPHRDDRGIETGRLNYPTFLRRVAALCEALNALQEPDPSGRESTYWAVAEGGYIGLYNEEAEDDTKPHAALEGWLAPDGDVGWTFIARKPLWSEGTPSDAAATA